MISARDELRHLIECLTDDECEQALDLLTTHWNRCPWCGEYDLDQLVWDQDGENASCEACGFCWAPDRTLVHRPK